jgi:hypothetical protein
VYQRERLEREEKTWVSKMIANDVYTIAKHLSKEEIVKLYNMLKNDVQQNKIKLKKNSKLPDFTMEDGLHFLLKNHITKKNKP